MARVNLPPLTLSLQFGRFDGVDELRAAMPRAQVLRWVRHALVVDPSHGSRHDDPHANAVSHPAAVSDPKRQTTATPPRHIPAEITVRVVDADEGLALNAQFRGKAYATNVLTFDYSRDPLAADLVLCAPVLQAEAAQTGVTLTAHCAHLIVHGTLHALGHDHETNDAAAEAMEALEAQVLARLGFANPYRTQR